MSQTNTEPQAGAEVEPEAGLTGITIEDLAQRTGMTVRNIRAHQSRGLLDPPEVVGRTGFYNEEHIGRIALIRELQEEGFNLEAIRRIIDSARGSSGDLLDFTRTARAPFESEQPEIIEAAELAAPWGEGTLDREQMKRVEELGLMRPIGGGRYEILSPTLYAAGVEMVEFGVQSADALETMERLKVRSDAVANVFIELFVEQIWKPFDQAGRPREEWPRIQEALTRLRPLASDAFLAAFQIAMEEGSERAISEGIRRDIRKAETERLR
ncbi:MAG: MerR family transcriptional regulator [Solirubrobacterales bacterium]|nr:MerR family transcriptional regulator [Solirubrobacterales bacterium]